MEPITETKKLKLLTEEELPSKIEILMKDSNENIRKLGKELKKGLDTGFENLNALLGEISKLLLIGALTPFILLIVLSALSIAIITVPSAIIITALSNQKRFIKSRAKADEVTKSYFTAVNNLIANDLTQSVSLEALFENALEIISPIMEAPKPKEDEEDPEENTEEEQPEEETPEENNPEEDTEPEEDESTDYTEDVDSPDEEEARDADMTANDFTGDVVNPDDETPEEDTPETPEDEQPEDYTGEVEPTDDTEETPEDTGTEDTDEETPEDYTADAEPTDDTAGGEDIPADGEVPEDGTDTGEEEVPQEEPQDFTADVDGGTDDTGEDTANDTGEETTDDTTDDTTETGEDNNNLENSIVKNYNLMVDYQKMHSTIDDILKHLKTVTYTTTIQNSVLDRCINNLTKVKDELLAYIEFNYSNDYNQNLYYYSTFIQALKLNLDVLRSIKKLTEETKQ